MKPPIRVLVVDDSAVMRKLIPQMLQKDEEIEVVGTAINGNFALRKIEELRPDVITLDLEMPGLNGIETLKQIMRTHKTPVVVVSSYSKGGASITMKALALGAVDFVAKPVDLQPISEMEQELIAKIKAAATSQGVCAIPESPVKVRKPASFSNKPATRVIAIGISTGGPNTLQYLLSQLPADFPGSIVIVQHMPGSFTKMFAQRLDDSCALQVREAQSGDLLLAGRVLVCPGNQHVRLRQMRLADVVSLSNDEKVNGHRPSVDVLFHSLAKDFGARAVALIMTGMGDDGAEGMGAVRDAGGMTIAQSEESCVVYGMPRVAIQRGYAQRVVSLEALAHTLQAICAPERGSSTGMPAVSGASAGTTSG